MQNKLLELTEAEMKAVIGGARLPASPYQGRTPDQFRKARS
jgi:bacteriocin-like protein